MASILRNQGVPTWRGVSIFNDNHHNMEPGIQLPITAVGSEAYGAVYNGRKAIGIELKPTYFRQAVKNLELAGKELKEGELAL